MRLCFVVLLLSCSCKRPPAAVPDAGTPIERGTDLRSAMTSIFPEYRGVSLVAGRAQINRRVGPVTAADLKKAQELAVQNGFKGDPPMRPPFAMEQKLEGDTLVQEVRLALSPEELGRILAAPAAMTSEALANWLPKVGPKLAEDYELELLWVAKDAARAAFLVWQLVDGALAVGWKYEKLPSGWELQRVDAGPVQVPNEFSLTLRNAALGAFIEIDRKAERAKLRYGLVTFERR